MKQRTILSASVLVALSLVLTNCRKDEPVSIKTNPIEQPSITMAKDYFLDYLSKTGFTQTNSVANQPNHELGYEFKSEVDGEISAIAVKIPNTNPALRVTLWDAETGTVIHTENVNVISANNLYEKSISPINILKNRRYAITFNTKDWYFHRNPSMAETTYPIKVGNLLYTKVLEKATTSQVLPNSAVANTTSVFGRVSFKFKPL